MNKRILKVLLAVLIPILLVGGGVFAYLALTSTVDVTVSECLSWSSPNSFIVSLYPGETQVLNLSISNASSADIEVTLKTKTNPKIKGLEVIAPDTLTALAGSSTGFTITVVATPSVEPGSTMITTEYSR